MDVEIEITNPDGEESINGSCDPLFKCVLEKFENNFAHRNVVGA
jgi:hypothetical protein